MDDQSQVDTVSPAMNEGACSGLHLGFRAVDRKDASDPFVAGAGEQTADVARVGGHRP